MSKSIRQIESEIRALQGELKSATSLKRLKKNSDFGLNEKIDIFDSLYSHVFNMVKDTIDNQRPPKDAEHCLFEKVMETFMGDRVWGIWNRYDE